MMGLPEFGEHQLAIMLGGPERDEFFTKAQPWLDAMTVTEAVELSQAMRIPAAPVSDGESISACPHTPSACFLSKAVEDAAGSTTSSPFGSRNASGVAVTGTTAGRGRRRRLK